MADIKINSLNSVSEKSAEIKQLTEQESQAVVGGLAFSPSAFASLAAVNLQAAWCWCGGGTILV